MSIERTEQLETIASVLAVGRAQDPALGAPGRATVDYSGLRDHGEQIMGALNASGIGRNDRVAIVLPNGPEMASAFVTFASCATTAPLNPAYRRKEYDFYLSDLGAKALVVEARAESPAIDAAVGLGIPVLQIEFDPQGPAGCFEIHGRAGASVAAAAGGVAGPDDLALVLHTSGTTSRPKIVPLTHRSVCASAQNICDTLSLERHDRCLSVMPLFHIHGLMAAVLATFRAGASVSCTPGFNALKFFAWLDQVRPSWYTAVPTMHQAILARAPRNPEVVAAAPLRFIRSSSSSLPPQVMSGLEDTFGVPVVEAYAMTEAAHQMTCNQLPPGIRKPGTVGTAAGPEVAVMDAAGQLLEPGGVGEVVIRGRNVTGGYENNPEANAAGFSNGWFRTGDQGVMDAEGYLTITGRLKEIINRGGEKISPLEVDVVLMDHPAVMQVVTFASPHPKLGEEVAAAVVLHPDQEATEAEIRGFASERLADFKVPRKVLFLEEIPKGPTGKMQRIGLAAKLGLGEAD